MLTHCGSYLSTLKFLISSSVVLDCSVSGQISLDIASAAGADMTDAEIRCVGGTCAII